jgi:hypothetical protein
MRIDLLILTFFTRSLAGPVPLCVIRHEHARPATERESSAARLASQPCGLYGVQLDLPRGPPEGVTEGATTLLSHFEPLGLTGLGIPRA